MFWFLELLKNYTHLIDLYLVLTLRQWTNPRSFCFVCVHVWVRVFIWLCAETWSWFWVPVLITVFFYYWGKTCWAQSLLIPTTLYSQRPPLSPVSVSPGAGIIDYPLIYMDSGLGLNSALQACETGSIVSTDLSHQPLPPPGILIRWLLYSPC